MSEFRKAKVGEPFNVDVEGKYYDERISASFEPMYNSELIDITQISVKSIRKDVGNKLSIGEECFYEYKITPKNKGRSQIKFGTWGCFGFNEKSVIELDVE